jgi:two-component system, sensor histidine kinase RpfC
MTQVQTEPNQVHSFLQGLYARTDPPELEQGLIRVAFGTVILVFCLAYSLRDGHVDTVEQKVLVGTLLYLAVSIAFVARTIWAGDVSVFRRYASMLLDIVAITSLMLTMGEAGAVMFGLYLFLIFGYGFRYGRAYLHICQAMALIGFGSVLLLHPAWSTSLSVGLACFCAILILPFYVGVLAQRIVDARRRAEEASQTKTNLLEYVSRKIGQPLDTIIAEYNASLGREPQ